MSKKYLGVWWRIILAWMLVVFSLLQHGEAGGGGRLFVSRNILSIRYFARRTFCQRDILS